MFAYCLNNPVYSFDPHGMCAHRAHAPWLGDCSACQNQKPVWVQMGFSYNGSMTDYRRIKEGLPPLEYDKMIKNGGTVNLNRTVSSEHGVTIVLESVTYIPQNMTKDFYAEKLEDSIEASVTSDFLFGLGTITLFVEKIHPLITVGLYLADAIEWFNSHANRADNNSYKKAMDGGTGVLVVTWTVSGIRSGNSSYTFYYSWYGKG